MSKKSNNKKEKRIKRHRKIRSIISGDSLRPRVCVFRSRQHIYAQLIDDQAGRTLAAVHSKALAKSGQGKLAIAEAVGQELAKRAMDKKIKQVVFDRGANKYQGRVKAVAEGARSQGLVF